MTKRKKKKVVEKKSKNEEIKEKITKKIHTFLRTHNKRSILINLLILLFFSAAIWFGLQAYKAYNGDFTEDVSHSIYVVGNVGELFENGPNSDYVIWITYNAKGAFIAGEAVHVNATLFLNDISYKGHNFTIVFPDSLPYPAPKGIERVKNGQIDLTYVDDKTAIGEVNISYLMSGGKNIDLVYFPPNESQKLLLDKRRESVAILNNVKYGSIVTVNTTEHTIKIPEPKMIEANIREREIDTILYSSPGQNNYNVRWDDTARGNYISIGHELNVAPLETRLQIQNNNIMLALTYVVLTLTRNFNHF